MPHGALAEQIAVEFIRSIKNVSMVSPETIFRYGLMMIALFILVDKAHHVVEYCFVGLLIVWGSVKLSRRDYHFVRTPLDLPILLFVIWILVTIPFSVDPAYSLTEWRKTVVKILMFYFVVNVVRTEQDVRSILLAFMLGVVALSAFGIVDHLVKGNSLFDKTSHTASLSSSGQWFSTYLVMGVPFVWLVFLEREGRHATWSIGLLFVMILTALFLSHTRGAWVAFFAQLAVFGLLNVKHKWRTWGLVAVTCGVIFIGGSLFKEFQGNLAHNIQDIPLPSLLAMNTMKIRLDIWQTTIEQILAQPILGYGYGNHTFQQINKEILVGFDNRLMTLHVHNAWLSLAYEVGLIGFALFAFVYFMIIRAATQGWKKWRGTFVGNLGLCILLLAVGVVTRNMFDTMFAGSLAYLFWLLTGLYFALRIHQDTSGRTSSD